MKAAIISDIHDNLANLEKFLNWANKNKIKELIICGDLCTPATLAKILAPNFKGKIHIVYGNVCDLDLEIEKAKEFSHIIHYGDEGRFEIDDKKVAIVHLPDRARKLAQSHQYDFVFYGHTHKPWLETVNQTQLVNPGTLAGMFYKATFAVWDTSNNKLELKILEKI